MAKDTKSVFSPLELSRLYRKDNVNRNPATAKNTKQTSVAEIKKKLEQKSEAASTKHSPANPWNLRGSGDRAIPDSGATKIPSVWTRNEVKTVPEPRASSAVDRSFDNIGEFPPLSLSKELSPFESVLVSGGREAREFLRKESVSSTFSEDDSSRSSQLLSPVSLVSEEPLPRPITLHNTNVDSPRGKTFADIAQFDGPSATFTESEAAQKHRADRENYGCGPKSGDIPDFVWKGFFEIVLDPLMKQTIHTMTDDCTYETLISTMARCVTLQRIYPDEASFRRCILPSFRRECFESLHNELKALQPRGMQKEHEFDVMKDESFGTIGMRKITLVEHVVQAAFGSGSSDNEPTNESGSSTSTEIEEEDEILWDKQLLLIKYTPECNGKMSKSGAFGLVVEKLSKPERRLVIEVLVHATQPSFRTSTGVPLKIVRLVPLFSMLRQSWALSWIGKNPQLADAFLSMPLQSYKPASKQMSADCMEHLNKLNDKQKKVTQNIAWTILGDPSSVNILALQGPPGTGKSQVVVGLVRALIALKRNARILIVAPTNTAVDAVGRRIVKSVMEVDLIHRDEDDICDRLDSEDDDVSEVDESQFQYPAGQALLLDSLIPLTILGIRKVVLIGDPKQLPATVLRKDVQDANYSLSWLERISDEFARYPEVFPMLNIQYRMHPRICDFPSQQFYDGMLQPHPSIEERQRDWWFEPFKFFDLSSSQEAGEKSKSNEGEVALIRGLLEYCRQYNPTMKDYAVITGYAAQQELFRERFAKHMLDGVRISTIDGFQGQEEKVIIISFVRTEHTVGFWENLKRMNVAITRAKCSLFIVGSAHTMNRNETWRKLIGHATSNGNLVEVRSARSRGNIFDCVRRNSTVRPRQDFALHNGAPWPSLMRR